MTFYTIYSDIVRSIIWLETFHLSLAKRLQNKNKSNIAMIGCGIQVFFERIGIQ